MIERPKTPIDEFEKALKKANLTDNDLELIEYIRYTSVFTQPSLIKDLKRPSKPPVLSNLCEISRKIGFYMPKHFEQVISWSKQLNEHNTKWDAHLICAEALTIDQIPLNPSSGTALFDVLVVHKELFTGFE
tara:strand:- start:134 stop:529 length:396 start_codon:yes stop_codon:yes gene_type:complete